MYNDILKTGVAPQNWYDTTFAMLLKSGDLKKVTNWRPIAILPVLYKIFAKMLHYRLQPILEEHQSHD